MKQPQKNRLTQQLDSLQTKLKQRLGIIQPAIDLCELIAARGNSSIVSHILEMAADLKMQLVLFANSCVQDTKFQEILNLETIHENSKDEKSLQGKIEELEKFIRMMDDMIPYIQLSLSITAQSALLTRRVSNSRLLQASNAFTSHPSQIGPEFSIKLYTLFAASLRSKNVADWTWQERFAKANAIVKRVNPNSPQSFEYRLEITQDFNDGRYHEDSELTSPSISKYLISDIHRLYYSSSGRLLNIQDAASSVLVLKIQKTIHATSSVPLENVVVEWIAIEAVISAEDSDDSSSDEEETPQTPHKYSQPQVSQQIQQHPLSLLEYIIRLCALEERLQMAHYKTDDDLLSMYLANDADYEKGARDEFQGGSGGVDRLPSHDVKDSPFKIQKTPRKK